MSKRTANRRFSDRCDEQKETLQIVFFDTEQPEGFESTDVLREKCKRELDLFSSLSDSFRKCTMKFRNLAFDMTGSILPGEMIVVRRWIYHSELSEICDDAFAFVSIRLNTFTLREIRRFRSHRVQSLSCSPEQNYHSIGNR